MTRGYGGIEVANWLSTNVKPSLNDMAADLSMVVNNEGPEMYRVADAFELYSYETPSMKKIHNVIKNKLLNGIGNTIHKISTPFGGGKTHMMISLFHKASKLNNVKIIVIDGNVMAGDQPLWVELNKHFRNNKLEPSIPPGSQNIRQMLESAQQPILILIDEIIEYFKKSHSQKLGETTLATQSNIFLQDLIKASIQVNNVCIVVSDPERTLTNAGDENTQELVEKVMGDFRKIIGRTEINITPIDYDDLPHVIRRKLFKTNDNFKLSNVAENIIQEHMDKIKELALLDESEITAYHNRFRETYPFIPDVIDTIFKLWGSFETFQRTRAILRLLALVVYNTRDLNKSYLTLADFDLEDVSIREEFCNHIERIYQSVITTDIISTTSNSKGMKCGKECATIIFLKSFAVSGAHGATKKDIKLSMLNSKLQSHEIGITLENLKRKLYYMSVENDMFKFFNNPNLNSIMDKEKNAIEDDVLNAKEKELVSTLAGDMIVWPETPNSVPDNSIVKFVLLPEYDNDMINMIIYGGSRQYRNAVIVICPSENTVKNAIRESLRVIIACTKILENKIKYVNLTNEQKKLLAHDKNQAEEYIEGLLTKHYSDICIPQKDNFKIVKITQFLSTIFDSVMNKVQNNYVHERLTVDAMLNSINNEIPFSTLRLYQNMLNTPGGEIRPMTMNVIKSTIKFAIEEKRCGIGYKDNITNKINYKHDFVNVSFSEVEYLMPYEEVVTSHTRQTVDAPILEIPPHLPNPKQRSINEISIQMKIKHSDLKEIFEQLHDFNIQVTLKISGDGGNITQDTFENIKNKCKAIDVDANVSPAK